VKYKYEQLGAGTKQSYVPLVSSALITLLTVLSIGRSEVQEDVGLLQTLRLDAEVPR
jgi:hypothetical protein